jgi:hypothetical protein
MPAWKCWFDLRLRFYYSLVGLVFLLTLTIGLYLIAEVAKPSGPLIRAAMQGIQRQPYSQYINEGWFSGKGTAGFVLLVSALSLATGGILAEKKTDTLLLTLSFPVRRWRWIFVHAALVAGLTLALSLIATFAVVLESYVIGKPYPIESSLTGVTIGLWLGCFPWIGLGLLANSCLHSGMNSILIILAINLILPRLSPNTFLSLYHWTPWCLSEHAFWRQSIPWGAMLVSVAIGLIGILLSVLRLAREDI